MSPVLEGWNSSRGHVREAFEKRFWARVDRDREQWTCWLWTGAVTSPGYGAIYRCGGGMRSANKMGLAHRAAWQLTFRSPIPPGMNVLHRCDEPLCVNPSHLFLGTASDNMHDMVSKKRHATTHRRQTHCRRGHPRIGEGARVFMHHGYAECQTCREIMRKPKVPQ